MDYTQIGFPPLLLIVSRINQSTVTSVLEYTSNWLRERELLQNWDDDFMLHWPVLENLYYLRIIH